MAYESLMFKHSSQTPSRFPCFARQQAMEATPLLWAQLDGLFIITTQLGLDRGREQQWESWREMWRGTGWDAGESGRAERGWKNKEKELGAMSHSGRELCHGGQSVCSGLYFRHYCFGVAVPFCVDTNSKTHISKK